MHFYLLLSTCVSGIGGFLFGYDVGIISGVLEMTAFKDRFDTTNAAKKGFIVASLTLGCFFGSLLAGLLSDRFGRRKTIILGAAIFFIGGALQTGSVDLVMLYFGRFIAGLAVGILSMVVPLYLSEISPKEFRGAVISIQQLAITIGILFAFLINYGTNNLTGDASYRVPFGIQVALGIFMSIGMIGLPASPRWLLSKGRTEDAARSLGRLRNLEQYNAELQAELDEMQDSLRIEREIGEGAWADLVVNGMWRRVAMGVGVQIFQQLTGINAVMYYAPKILQEAGFSDTSVTLLATAGSGIVNVLMTIPGIYLIDRAGRRKLLVSGAIFMAIAMSIFGILSAVYGPNFDNKAVPYVSLIMMYIFVGSFAYSWGPIGWVYPSEIYPLRIRAKAVSITTASNWLFNFCIGQVVPALLDAISWGVFLLFAGFGVIMAVWVFFVLPETKGKSLEEVEELFNHHATKPGKPVTTTSASGKMTAVADP